MQQITVPTLNSNKFGQLRAKKRSFKVCRVRCVTEQEAATTTAGQKISTKPGIVYTHYESNTFTLTFNKTGVTMLNDPWLVDDLYFSSMEWIFRAKKRVVGKNKPIDIDYFNKNTDFIHISQPISDHLHRPTLRVLDKSLPVVASVPAAEVVKQEFGYKNVTPIDHGESVTICDGKLTLTATQGALTGPPWAKRNNGIVIRENVEGGVSVYFEPHCDFEPESVRKVSPVDIVITPVVSQYLGSYPLVRGLEGIDQLLEITKPKKILRLINGEVDQQGPLSLLIQEKGSTQDFEYKLKAQNSKFKGIEIVPVKQPGEEVLIELD
eukprot:TRINITY_DN39696_c0_g1_i1.p1 TRINITY_DN39696_c0_g1~~TRINITY_DN39696_c0_g1_i1.p1  ORF type:complete len:349 (-),score=22.60 TRINITY_DN39696_c0_g1_i1:379-1347(-)